MPHPRRTTARAERLARNRAFRTCLKCNKKFDSTSPCNRICPECIHDQYGLNLKSTTPTVVRDSYVRPVVKLDPRLCATLRAI